MWREATTPLWGRKKREIFRQLVFNKKRQSPVEQHSTALIRQAFKIHTKHIIYDTNGVRIHT
jgi:hypothetical protein